MSRRPRPVLGALIAGLSVLAVPASAFAATASPVPVPVPSVSVPTTSTTPSATSTTNALTAIAARYAALGGSASLLGLPVGSPYAVADGRAQNYTGGRIYWSAATGAHEVHGMILARYLGVGGPVGRLGFPTSDETVVTGGRLSAFTGGRIYWSFATGAHPLVGGVLDRYLALGGPSSLLGLPSDDERTLLNGSVTAFRGGRIYRSPYGSHEVHGAILGDYLATGGPAGPLSWPTTDERPVTGVTGARESVFAGGREVWSPRTAAHEVHGAIYAKWSALGGATSPLGLPTADESAVIGGRSSAFVSGRILWSVATGAHEVHGPILSTYVNLGASGSYLGLPKSDVHAVTGGLQSDFVGGTIRLDNTTGQATASAPPATSGPGWWGPLGVSSAPAYTSSHYATDMTGNPTQDATIGYNHGCTRARAGNQGLVVLDYGAQTVRGTWGTWKVMTPSFFLSDATIIAHAEGFLQGYRSCLTHDVGLVLALGTNNSGSPTYGGSSGGADWARLVNTVSAWSASRGYQAHLVSVAGANDIEPGFGAYTPAQGWVNSYGATTRLPWYNYGSADGCAGVGGNTICSNSWNVDQLWTINANTPNARSLPEIYTNPADWLTMGSQWAHISLWGVQNGRRPLTFAGEMTQSGACAQSGGCGDTGIGPVTGWNELFGWLRRDARTSVGSLPFSTDIMID